MTNDFNLWDDPWIRVLRLDGARAELSMRATLLNAHTVRALHDPSPLTVAGIHRLLTAIVQAIAAPESLGEIAAVLADRRFDPISIDTFGTQFRHRFGLFNPTAPFMQTADAPATPGKAAKTVAYLLTEVPSGTNRAHFHHVTDDAHRLCPACCARALVVVPAFASAGGSGHKPSINGQPPMYLLPVGPTLFHSLARSLTVEAYQPPQADPLRSTAAVWSGAVNIPKAQEQHDVGYLESLTFPARRIRLYPQVYAGCCSQCGAVSDVAVATMVYDMGLSRPKRSALWRDPFIAFAISGKEHKLASIKPRAGRALWREYGTLLLSQGTDVQPLIVAQTRVMIDNGYLPPDAFMHFRCIGLRTDQAKSIEWFDETLDVPPTLLRDPAGAQVVRQALERAEVLQRDISRDFTKVFQPHHDREWFTTLRRRMEGQYWMELAAPFRALVQATSVPLDYDALDRTWATQVLQVGRAVAHSTLAHVGDGVDLLVRRVQAEHQIGSRLRTYRKEWVRDGRTT